MDDPACRLASLLELQQVAIKMSQRFLPNGRATVSQRLPVCLFGHQQAPLALDHVGGMPHILPHLRIAQ